MVIVNTTFLLSEGIVSEALQWIRDAYAPSAIKCHASLQPMLLRVLSHAEPGTAVYALHATFDTLDEAERWNNGVADKLRNKMNERWGQDALTFQTYLETVR